MKTILKAAEFIASLEIGTSSNPQPNAICIEASSSTSESEITKWRWLTNKNRTRIKVYEIVTEFWTYVIASTACWRRSPALLFSPAVSKAVAVAVAVSLFITGRVCFWASNGGLQSIIVWVDSVRFDNKLINWSGLDSNLLGLI